MCCHPVGHAIRGCKLRGERYHDRHGVIQNSKLMQRLSLTAALHCRMTTSLGRPTWAHAQTATNMGDHCNADTLLEQRNVDQRPSYVHVAGQQTRPLFASCSPTHLARRTCSDCCSPWHERSAHTRSYGCNRAQRSLSFMFRRRLAPQADGRSCRPSAVGPEAQPALVSRPSA